MPVTNGASEHSNGAATDGNGRPTRFAHDFALHPQRAALLPFERFLSDRACSLRQEPIVQIMKDGMSKGTGGPVYAMAGGKPTPSTFAIKGLEITLKSGEKVSVSDSDLVQGNDYGHAAGLPSMVEWCKDLTSRVHKVPREAFGCTVPAGSCAALHLFFDLVLNRGEAILCDAPTFTGAMTSLYSLCAKMINVETDVDGPIPESLETVLSTWDEKERGAARPKVFYTVPTGGNPTGMNTTTARKHRVLEICGRYDVMILEDDPYYFLSFAEEAPVSYFSLVYNEAPSPAPIVVRFDSFAKMLSAGARVSWVTGPKALTDILDLYTMGSIQHGSLLAQAVLMGVLDRWGIDGFLENAGEIRDFYRQRRDKCLEAAERYLKGLCEWEVPRAGMFLWLKLLKGAEKDKGIDDTGNEFYDAFRIVVEGLLPADVLAVPGRPFFPEAVEKCPYIRISYSMANDEQLDAGFKKMAKILRANAGMA